MSRGTSRPIAAAVLSKLGGYPIVPAPICSQFQQPPIIALCPWHVHLALAPRGDATIRRLHRPYRRGCLRVRPLEGRPFTDPA
jgi:hypothetical protein